MRSRRGTENGNQERIDHRHPQGRADATLSRGTTVLCGGAPYEVRTGSQRVAVDLRSRERDLSKVAEIGKPTAEDCTRAERWLPRRSAGTPRRARLGDSCCRPSGLLAHLV